MIEKNFTRKRKLCIYGSVCIVDVSMTQSPTESRQAGPEACYLYLVPIFLPETDNLLKVLELAEYETSSPKGNDAHLRVIIQRGKMEISIFQTLKGS